MHKKSSIACLHKPGQDIMAPRGGSPESSAKQHHRIVESNNYVVLRVGSILYIASLWHGTEANKLQSHQPALLLQLNFILPGWKRPTICDQISALWVAVPNGCQHTEPVSGEKTSTTQSAAVATATNQRPLRPIVININFMDI